MFLLGMAEFGSFIDRKREYGTRISHLRFQNLEIASITTNLEALPKLACRQTVRQVVRVFPILQMLPTEGAVGDSTH